MVGIRQKVTARKGAQDGPAEGSILRTALGSSDFYLPFMHRFAVPKNTAKTAYTSYTLPIPASQVERIWVEFPRGCAGLVGFQLWRGVEQVFPNPAGNWLISDGYTLNFRLSHVIDREPYEVELRGYNTDDTYQHTIWVMIELRGLDDETSPQLQSFLQALKG